MKKLISMVDFVLTNKYTATGHKNYANFLKQPLELWMFVPCNENGNVLKIIPFDEHKKGSNFEFKQHEDYRIAKERCLFVGFSIETKKFNNDSFDYVQNGKIYVFAKGSQWINNNQFKTIEDIVKYNLELTPTALKQIGL